MTGEDIGKFEIQQQGHPPASIVNQTAMENSRDTHPSSPLIPSSASSSASGRRGHSQSVVEFPSWLPVVNDSLRRSFVLPSAGTLEAVRQARQSPVGQNNGSSTRNSGGSTRNNGDGKKGNGADGGNDRPISPMATLLIRTDY